MKSPTAAAQLKLFLAEYTPDIRKQAAAALKLMTKRLPYAHQMVYDNYNALVIGFVPNDRPSDAVFSIAVFPTYLTLFFIWGKGLPDPKKLLQGKGKQVRSIRLESAESLLDPDVQKLMDEAEMRSKVPFDETVKGRLFIKSISANKRPRRPKR